MIQLLITEAQQPGDPRASAPPFLRHPRELSLADHMAPCAGGVSPLGPGGGGGGRAGRRRGPAHSSLREAKLAQGPGHPRIFPEL